jgi:hypothetical protein
MDESYQDDPPSAAMATTSSYKIDPNWYADTGTTNHITSDLDRLAVRERYHGGEQVHVGNGAGLQILHIGHSSINTVDHSLALRNILHTPKISKDLLSVHKFMRDNNVFFEFHPWHFSIKDRTSRKSLLEGRCEAGLYPIKQSAIADLRMHWSAPPLMLSGTLALVTRHLKSFSLFCISIIFLAIKRHLYQSVMHVA